MSKTARLEARITPELHGIIKRAAEIEGRSVTDFVVSAAQEAAERRIERSQMIRLAMEDQKTFFEAILNPPKPSPALLRTIQSYHDLIDESK